MPEYKDRLTDIKLRIARAKVLYGTTQKDIASAINKQLPYMHNVLSGNATSRPMLDLIDGYLSDIESIEIA